MFCDMCGNKVDDQTLVCLTCGNKITVFDSNENPAMVPASAATVVEAAPVVEAVPAVEAPVAEATPAVEAPVAAAEPVAPAPINLEKAVEPVAPVVEAAPAAEATPVVPVAEAAPVAPAPAVETLVAPIPTAEPIANPVFNAYEQPNNGGAGNGTPVGNNNVGKKSGGVNKKVLIPIIAAVAVVALIAIIVAANFKYITNSVMKNGKADTYFKWVAKNYVTENTQDAMDLYSDYIDIYDFADEKIDTTVEAELGEDAERYLKLLKRLGYDFTWVDTAAVDFSIDSKDDLLKAYVGASFNGVELMSVDYIADITKEEEYISFPFITNVYGSQESEFDLNDMADEMDEYSAIVKAVPDKKVMKKLILKYLETAIDQVGSGEVKVSDKTLRANGLSQNVTAITVTIDNDLCSKIATEILSQMQDDKELRKVIEKTIKDLDGTELYDDYDLDDFDYDEFLEELADLEEEMEDAEFLVSYDWRTGKEVEEEIKYTLYVNAKGEVIGEEVSYESEANPYNSVESKSYKVTQGSKVAYKMESGMFEISAVGKEIAHKFTGTVNIEYIAYDIAEIEVTGFNVDAFKKGKLIGKFVIIPDESLYRLASEFSFAKDITIALDCNTSLDSGKVGVEFFDDDEMVAKFKVNYKIAKGTKIKIPSGKNVIDMEDDDAGEELYDTFNKDKYVKDLEKAGAPDDFIEEIEDIEDYDDFLDFLDSFYF